MARSRRTRPAPRSRAPVPARPARPAPRRAPAPEPSTGGFRWWYAAWVPAVATSVVLGAAFLALFTRSSLLAAALVWLACMVSIPVSGMAVAVPVAVLLRPRYAAGLAAATLAASAPAALWSAGYVLERVDGGAQALGSPAVLAVAELWVLAAVLLAAAVLTLLSAAIQGVVDLFSRR